LLVVKSYILCRGRDGMVVWLAATCGISAYHH